MSAQTGFQNLIKCKCQHCNGPLEFDASVIPRGTVVPCPHCQMETMLYMPQGAVVEAPKKKSQNRSLLFVAIFVAATTAIATAIIMLSSEGDDGKAFPSALATGLIFALLTTASIGFYFLPTLIARQNKKANSHAIFVLNLLAGWTFIGWVAAIVWASMKDAQSK